MQHTSLAVAVTALTTFVLRLIGRIEARVQRSAAVRMGDLRSRNNPATSADREMRTDCAESRHTDMQMWRADALRIEDRVDPRVRNLGCERSGTMLILLQYGLNPS